MKFPLGTPVIATGESIHAAQSGIVAADYDNYIMIRVNDESYAYAHKSTTGPGKYIHVDSRYLKQVKVKK